jgi:hypothetical protein
MSRNRAERSRALGFFGGLSAFVLSAALGVAFVGLVVKTHELFACATFPGPTVIGTWQGQLHDLPAVTLTISREGEQLTGTVLFQPVVKTEQGARLAGTPVTVPLKDAWFDGKTLRFKLDDSRAARELRESGIEMTLTNADHAQLRLAACSYDGGPKCEEVALTRTA